MSRRIRLRIIPWLLATACLWPLPPVAASDGLSGTWQLDSSDSDDFSDSAKELNRRLNEQKRDAKKQEFIDTSRPRSRNRFQNQANAAERMIREDLRSLDWETDADVVAIANAESIKIYHSRRVVMLYDANFKRLLAINPSGRSFSFRGGEVSKDDVGTSITYEDGDALVIETDLYDGGTLIERYARDGERLRQTLSYKQDSVGPELAIERLFDRAP